MLETAAADWALRNSPGPPRPAPLDAAAPWSKIGAIRLARRRQIDGGSANATSGFGCGIRGCIGVGGFGAGRARCVVQRCPARGIAPVQPILRRLPHCGPAANTAIRT